MLAALFLILSYAAPPLMTANYYERSLKQLREKKESIKSEFSQILDEFADKHEILSQSDIPDETEARFNFLKNLCTQPEIEGITYYDEYGDLELWYGKIIDIRIIFGATDAGTANIEQKSTLLTRYKASIYLVSFQEMLSGSYVVFFRRLAFLPEFKAQHLQERHFLKPSLMERCEIDYQDFREDATGSENFFARNQDEYIGQPRLQDNIQTLYFPLRNEKDKMVATVTLRSPSLPSQLSSQKENFMMIFYLMLGLSTIFLLFDLNRSIAAQASRMAWRIALFVALLIGLRALFHPLSRLTSIQALPIFSPTSTSFVTLGDLAKSPADIFLTSLIFCLLIVFLVRLALNNNSPASVSKNSIFSVALNVFFVVLTLACLWFFREILERLVVHSSYDILSIRPDPAFLFVQASIFLFFVGFFLIGYAGFRIALRHSLGLRLPLLILCLGCIGFLIFAQGKIAIFILMLLPVMLISIWLTAYFSQSARKYGFGIFILAVLFIYATIYSADVRKKQTIVQNSLKNSITSQEDWGYFLLQQSLPEIDKSTNRIKARFQQIRSTDLARELWRSTFIAKSNWNSSLEILSPNDLVLSRFSLNIPELYRPQLQLPVSSEWVIFPQKISYWREDKEFLIAYKDWMEADQHLGRIIIYLSIDYEMLPFLYSATPYFEMLRIASYPALDHLDLRFAVFDQEGKLIFNPNNISSGIPASLLSEITSTENHLWTDFSEGGNGYKGLFFAYKEKVFALLLPQRTFLNYSVEFLKLLFLYLVGLLIIGLLNYFLSERKPGRSPLWSFSSRVYISFVGIALIPLILFTFSTRSFFAGFFSQKVTAETESQANFAHRFMRDIIHLQQEEQVSLTIPPENVVLWISSTISNDVNLYLDGRIADSNHSEFFEYGLLPEYIDGEIFYKIQYENNPFYTQVQSIGDYSFHTLTIPYYLEDNFLLISLPFPMEQQEIAQSTAELFEFLFFLSAFFIIFVVLFARAIGETIISPIRKLIAGTKEVTLGNLEISIPYTHEDEMKTLVHGFNDMVKSLKKHQQEVADLSKKVAWAEMARKVAHEIKNPLTPIQLSAEHLLQVYQDKREDFQTALKESTSYIVKEVENLRRIAQEFLETSKETLIQKEELDLKFIIQETIAPYKSILSKRIEFKERYEGDDFVFSGDKAKIKIVLRNILTNAIESIREHGTISIQVQASDSQLDVEIADTGTGLDKDTLDRIFEPYFSTKDVGTGLGLPIAKKIIADHEGTIRAKPNLPHGLRIFLTLPKL